MDIDVHTGECHVSTKAGVRGASTSQGAPKVARGPPEAGADLNTFSPEGLRRNWPCPHLDDLLPPGDGSTCSCCFKTPDLWGLWCLAGQPLGL